MPKTDPTGRHSKMGRLPGTPPLLEPSTPHTSVQNRSSAAAQAYDVCGLQEMERVAFSDDEFYIKLIPSELGKAWHLFGYFKRGQWKDHYVYAVAFGGDLAGGFAHLAKRISEVREGIRRPSRDNRKGTR